MNIISIALQINLHTPKADFSNMKEKSHLDKSVLIWPYWQIIIGTMGAYPKFETNESDLEL